MAHFCSTNKDCEKCAWSGRWDDGEDDGITCSLMQKDITFVRDTEKPCSKPKGSFYTERNAV